MANSTENPIGRVEPIDIESEMKDSFLEYAMSVIVARALPDVRDGLKPVHRRILFSMYDSGIRPGTPFRKCARVVGDVMGWFHPHSNDAIYDALVRLGQDFASRYPLVEPQGNFGTVDDPPAAMRYCVTGDTMVRTVDGTVAIADIVDSEPNSDSDIDLKVLDRHHNPVRATKFFHSGDHPTLRLRTREGFEITGTHNHPLLCLVELAGVPMLVWRLLEEIEPGDRVVVLENAGAADESRLPDRIPYIERYVRSASGTSEFHVSEGSLSQRSFWVDRGEDGLSRIQSPEVRDVVRPLVEAGYYYATVESVAPAGIQPVYSIRVDSEDHSFLANGFVNHNTETRMAPLAMHLLDGIDERTVNWQDNYSGEREEPIVLPSRFPNLLVNGSTGIAVGMATNIPPHNLTEVVDAVVHMVDNPEATAQDLTEFIKGPDFPTGAYIVGTRGIKDALLTGKGSVKMRAVLDVQEIRKNRTAVVVTEIPYQASRDRIMERIATLVRDKTIAGIADLRDESDRDGTRLVIELKRDAIPQVVINQLYKHTQLQDNFSVNAVALVDGVPRTLNVAQMIDHYITHQLEIIERRTQYRLEEAERRAHILQGLLIALDNIDEVVQIIRSSANVDEARNTLMERFELDAEQTKHILDMPLRRLTALESDKLREEYQEKMALIKDLKDILGSETRRREIVKTELSEIKEKFGDRRRSRIIPDEGELSLEDLIADEDLVVTVTSAGYVKSVLASTYRTQGRGGRGVKGAQVREDDVITHVLHTSAHAYLLFFTNRGKVYRIKSHELPRKDRTSKGVLVHSVLPLEPDERVEQIIDTRDYESFQYLVMFTKHGQVKKTKFSEYDSRQSTLIAINLADDDEVVAVRTTTGEGHLLMFTKNGQGIRFSESDVRPMGRGTQGVRGIKLKGDDEVVSAASAEEGDDVLLVTSGGYGKRTKMSEFPLQKRGGMGVKAIKLTRVRGVLVSGRAVSQGDQVFAISSDGIVIRQSVDDVSRQGRPATGVRFMNLEDGAEVSAIALVPKENGEEA